MSFERDKQREGQERKREKEKKKREINKNYSERDIIKEYVDQSFEREKEKKRETKKNYSERDIIKEYVDQSFEREEEEKRALNKKDSKERKQMEKERKSSKVKVLSPQKELAECLQKIDLQVIFNQDYHSNYGTYLSLKTINDIFESTVNH